MSDPVLIGVLVGDVIGRLAQSPVRHPVVRSGERRPILWELRSLVYRRDGRGCVWCGSTDRLCLDHVVPWSAGGPDRGSNLRSLCWSCNDWRSNFALPMDDERPRLPVVWTCVPCVYERANAGRDWDERLTPPDGDRVTAWCGSCGLTSWTYEGDAL
jgi:hypothetical protein